MSYLINSEIIDYTENYDISVTASALAKNVKMNTAKLNV